ncbi:uncharacterized protein J3R85_000569 [Psidium guajava]|nr:uncharacterized protein J3R85_000569 [Psidium guajava]
MSHGVLRGKLEEATSCASFALVELHRLRSVRALPSQLGFTSGDPRFGVKGIDIKLGVERLSPIVFQLHQKRKHKADLAQVQILQAEDIYGGGPENGDGIGRESTSSMGSGSLPQ